MIKASITLQDLRRKIYIKAKAEKEWRFWGLYVHVCKIETLREAYKQSRENKGAAGIDGVTFEMIEEEGVEKFLKQIQSELKAKTYYPSRKRVQAIPKDNGKNRILSIPTIKDRVVEGALKLILEPIFEADFQPGSYGYRPKRTAAQAIETIAMATIRGKTKAIELDLCSYFDTIAHAKLFEKVAERVNDGEVMRLLKMLVKSGGKKGISQGSPLSPLLSNIYLNEVDKMLERAKKVTKGNSPYQRIEYVRWADDLLVLIEGHQQWNWLEKSRPEKNKRGTRENTSRTERREDKDDRYKKRREF
jgi:RNA-directed DNA polymerase